MECLREHKLQFYVVPDSVAPMKVVIRGLPKSSNILKIENEILKTVLMSEMWFR